MCEIFLSSFIMCYFFCIRSSSILCTVYKVLHVQGFPNWVDWWGDNLDKMAKNCMKMAKSAFLGQNSAGTNFSGSGGDPPSPSPVPPTRGNPACSENNAKY